MSNMPRNWTAEVVNQYIKPESQQKTAEEFRKTHLRIDRIRAEILRPHRGDDDFVTEEEFRDAVLDSSLEDDNRIFIIKGEVGSGKSHLCQWLEYEVNGYDDDGGQDDEHVAIHISRSNTKLDEILEKLHEPIDKEYEEVSDIGSLDPEEVADFIIQGLRTFYADKGQFKSFDLREFIREFDSKDDFRDVLVENIQEYQQSVVDEGKEQQIDLLTRKDYGQICFNVFGNTKREDDIYPAVRRAIHDLLTRNIGIEDFKSELAALSKEYEEAGLRPVLIAEDLTTFSVLKDDLLDHIFELSSGHYDVVMGWTTGWERENIDDALTTSEDSLTYMKERTQGYLSMTNEDGEAYFLEDGSMPVKLVKQYLDVIKEESDTDSVDIPEEAFDGLYPFNEALIRRAYDSLVQEGTLRQTPRLLLVHVVADCLTSDFPPHRKLETSAFIRGRASPIPLGKFDEEYQSLTKWYGTDTDGKIGVKQAVLGTFGLEIPEAASVTDGQVLFQKGIEFDIDVGEGSTGTSVESSSSETTTEDEDETTSDSDSDDEREEEETEKKRAARSKAEERYDQFQKWLVSGTDFPSSDTLQEGALEALNRWHDPARLANGNATTTGKNGIYYASGSEIPISIQGADERAAMSFEIPFDVEKEAVYTDLFKYGLSGRFDQDANFDAIHAWATDNVVDFRRRMRRDIEDVLPPEMSIEEFLVFSKYLLTVVTEGETDLTRSLLFTDYNHAETSPFREGHAFENEITPSMDDAFTEMAKHRSDLQSLLEGFFLLKESVVDGDRLSEAINGVEENLDEYLRSVSKISASELPNAYRIGTTRNDATKQVSTVFEAVSDFATELRKLHQQVSFRQVESEIERYRAVHSAGHTADELHEIYQKLDEGVGVFDVSPEPEWKAAENVLVDSPRSLHLSEFSEALDTFSEADPSDVVELLELMHEYEASKNDQKAWEVYDALLEMIEELNSVSGPDSVDFQNRLRDSSEFQQFTEHRARVQRLLEGF